MSNNKALFIVNPISGIKNNKLTAQRIIHALDADNIKLIVYDINGRQVRQLANGYYSCGSYDFSWNSIDDVGRKVSSGIYIYQLITSHDILTKKMLLLK